MALLRRTGTLLAAVCAALAVTLTVTVQPASAAWTQIAGGNNTASFLVCKTAETGGYGPVWKLTLVLASSPDYHTHAVFKVFRGTTVVNTVVLDAGNGAWDVKTTYASRYYDDTWDTAWSAGQISTGYGMGYGFSNPFSPWSFDNVAYC